MRARAATLAAIFQAASTIRSRRAKAGSLLAVACALPLLTGCGAQSGPHRNSVRRTSAPRSAPRTAPASTATPLVYHALFQLPAPVQDPAVAPLGSRRFVLLGGITAADTSTNAVTVANLSGTVGHAALPNAQHDAQAATLGGHVYVFGGGQYSQYDHVLGYDPVTNAVTTVAALPAPASDVAVAAGRSTAYVVGGFDGTNWLSTILAFRPGTPVRILSHLPVPLRYAAAAVVGDCLLIAGGSTPTEASSAIYRVDLHTGALVTIGHLPAAITHAAAGVLGSTMYVVGGRGDSVAAKRSSVYAINPGTGRVEAVGRLPHALSDAAVVSLPGRLIVAGGSSSGGTEAGVGELVPAS